MIRYSAPVTYVAETQRTIFDSDSVQEITKEFKNLTTSFVNLSARVEKRIAYLEELEDKRLRHEKEINDEKLRREKLVEDNLAKAQDRIKLDVGGTVFSTSKKTLLAQKDTYFYTMLASGRWQPELQDGAYFIDRDPLYFDRILNFLRTGRLLWEGLDEVGILKLSQDLDYFMIVVPEFANVYTSEVLQQSTSDTNTPKVLKWNSNDCGKDLKLSNGDLTVIKAQGSNDFNAAAIGTIPVTRFTAQLTNRENGGILLGMTPLSGYNSTGKNFNTSMYCVNVKNKSMYGPHSTRGSLVKMQTGSVVTVEYDKEKKEISFSVDGSKPVVGHTNVTGEMYPVVIIANLNASITLLNET